MQKIKLNPTLFDQMLARSDERRTFQVEGAPYMKIVVNKKWITVYAHFNAHGKVFKKKLGTYPDTDLETFKRNAEHYFYSVKQRLISHVRIRLDDLFLKFFVPYAKSNKLTYKNDIARYRDYIHPSLGGFFIDDVRSFHIQGMLEELPKRLAPATTNRIRSLLHKIFALAIENQLIFQNPCSLVKPKRENNVVERYLTEEEVLAFQETAEREWEQGDIGCGALLLALFTGIRIGNVLTIKHNDILDNGGTLRLPQTKSGQVQIIPLGVKSRELLAQAKNLSSNEYVFSSYRGSGHLSYPKNQFKKICVDAGISVRGALQPERNGFPAAPVTIHCLRKTFASRVLAETNDIYLCSTLLGHSDISVTKRYAFHSSSSKAAAVEHLFSLRRNKPL